MLRTLRKSNIKNKVVILRLDLNVPVFNNKILSDFRIIKSIPTIEYLLKNNNKIIIISHFGRPKEGEYVKEYSLEKVSKHLSSKINLEVKFVKDWTNGINFTDSNVVMCENIRFQKGEKSNSATLSKLIATLGDVYVFDAFGVAHRKEASTFGITSFIDSYAGLLIEDEIKNINKLVKHTKSPLVTIISGAKVSTKLNLINNLINKTDYMIIGGGILNTFLAALNYNIGLSLYEKSFVDEAKKIIESANFNKIILPIDVVCSDDRQPDNPQNKLISMVQSSDKILDVGKKTLNKYTDIVKNAKTVFWNGPLGYLEQKPYDFGTIQLSKAIASANNFSIIGGGDTIPIIEKLGIENDISCLSTGGGSLLKYIEGEKLPILEKLGNYEQ
ncbi:MAG: phosphoglycerate kinase [Pelagibacterales bacterium]|nr:phosphoglycerate kinase [Pelagibacterales bacterium]